MSKHHVVASACKADVGYCNASAEDHLVGRPGNRLVFDNRVLPIAHIEFVSVSKAAPFEDVVASATFKHVVVGAVVVHAQSVVASATEQGVGH